jgi:hypothetical protein
MRFRLFLFALVFAFNTGLSVAQYNHGFPYGKSLLSELDMKRYEPDTSAAAVVLDEFGEAYVDNGGENNILLEYHVKIKVLKKEGLSEANFSIPLYKSGARRQMIKSVQGHTASLENGQMKETEFNPREVVTEKFSEHFDRVVFTLPDVRVGSVFEVKYILESPFFWNFWPWKFQSHLPKRQSVFWARIPANYNYNVSIKGYLKFSKQESELVKNCYTPGGGNVADCSLLKFTMTNIPAFVEEEYMTAKENFLSALDFELTDIKAFDGRTFKYTQTWDAIEKELNSRDDFGAQLKKAKKQFAGLMQAVVGGETDPIKKASLIYAHHQKHYQWNEEEGFVTDAGIRTAFDNRRGSVADINLSLVAALEAAGLNAYPVLISTRSNGIPTKLYPVLSDFDYVAAYLVAGETKMVLDAAYPRLPMGMLPFKCLNGEGRVFGNDPAVSGWIPLNPKEKSKKTISIQGTLQSNGDLKATVSIRSFGYEALHTREKKNTVTAEAYIKSLSSNSEFSISNYRCVNADSIDRPLAEEMDIVWSSDLEAVGRLYFNPFFFDRWESNPFKMNERTYPVDFGAPVESVLSLNLQFPAEFELTETPEQQAFTLPRNGGKFLYSVSQPGNRVTATSVLNLTRATYNAEEYFGLKELFSRIVQLHAAPFVFTRTKN